MSESKFVASRRNVLKSAAWTAPVVVMATAAPAFAASGPAALSAVVNSAVASNGSPRQVTVTSTISNANTEASTSLTVGMTVDLTNANPWGASPVASATGYNGGAPVAGTGSGTSRSFTFTADSQIAGNSTKSFAPVVTTGGGTKATGTVIVNPMPGGAGTSSPSPSKPIT